ncbi:iron donor protein CyaY [Shewanella sp. JM162201]|uniref:Iron-sulfur cluster assembly protein CyaY n=1 Tax=Shewanella jiangmenensis TaxID=2837387 RepID=A0ABS5V7Z6_9GAMM|nr:iron donor protein CyaY [Shewanella jiangmenensis]MBT1446550.1 iron donor protein CyaY [Shewanella jiangmenensis]
MAMTDTEFHQLADDMFNIIETAIENAIDNDDADVDIDSSGGVLQLTFEDGSKIVINKQEPLHEVWLATRFGGYHFGFKEGKWIDERNGGSEFMPFLKDSIKRQANLNLCW